MMENITKQINSFLSALKTTYSQPGQTGRKLIPVLFLLVICCLCSVTISVLRPRNSPGITPSPNIFPTQGKGPTPTPLFNFGGATFTPFPTLPGPTAFPTFTPPPTGSPTATETLSAATLTLTPVPTATATNISITATVTGTGAVQIVTVDKPMEYVEIQNVGNAPVNLSGWSLVSETGNQSCALSGFLQPNEVLRIWTRRGSTGFSCGLTINIWNDNQADPAVLYDSQGEEVSRYP